MKKNSALSLIIWIIYGLIASCFCFVSAMTFGSEIDLLPVSGLSLGAGMLAAAFAVAWFLHKKVGNKRPDQPYSYVKEYLCLTVLLVGMVAVRVHLPLGQILGDLTTNPNYIRALVTEEPFLPEAAHGGTRIYQYLLHTAFVLLGNGVFAADILQLLLLVPAALMLYLGVSGVGGRLAGFFVVTALGFGPFFRMETYALTAFLPMVLFYGIALFFIAKIGKKGEDEKLFWAIVTEAAAGLAIGFCCYLDISGITLLIFMTCVVCFGTNRREASLHVIRDFLVTVAASAAGYVLFHAVLSDRSISFADSISMQAGLYRTHAFVLPVTVQTPFTLWDILLIAFFLAVGIYSYFFTKEIKGRAVWIFAVGVLFLMQCYGMNCIEYINTYAMLFLLIAALSGTACSTLFAPDPLSADEDEAGESDWNPAVNFALLSYYDDKPAKKVPEVQEPVAEDAAPAVSTDAVPSAAEDGASAAQEDRPVALAETQPEDKPAAARVNYIENPLPLPKKKEHKVMDYDYEVSDNDDFDLK